MTTPNRFRLQCRRLRQLTTWVAVAMTALLVLPFVLGLAQWGLGLQRGPGHWTGTNLLLGLVHMAPGACFVWALWTVRSALRDLVAGRLFHVTVARGLRHIGYAVGCGALLQLFAVTNLSRMITHGHGSYMLFDPASIALAIVGAMLVLLSHLVVQAERMRRELDEIV